MSIYNENDSNPFGQISPGFSLHFQRSTLGVTFFCSDGSDSFLSNTSEIDAMNREPTLAAVNRPPLGSRDKEVVAG